MGRAILIALIAIGALYGISLACPNTDDAPVVTTAPVAEHTLPGQACWIEHKPASEGGDEPLDGDPALMPPGSSVVPCARFHGTYADTLGPSATTHRAAADDSTASAQAKPPKTPRPHKATSRHEVNEDEPGYDCRTMGGHDCGPGTPDGPVGGHCPTGGTLLVNQVGVTVCRY